MIWWEMPCCASSQAVSVAPWERGPGFVAKDVKLPSLRLRGVERRGGAADIHEGQPAGVAVGEHVHAVANQLGAVPADGLAMPHVFVGEFLRRRQRQRLLFLDRLAGAHGLRAPGSSR